MTEITWSFAQGVIICLIIETQKILKVKRDEHIPNGRRKQRAKVHDMSRVLHSGPKCDLACWHLGKDICHGFTLVVSVLKKVSLKQNKSHSRSLDLHLVFINEGLPE